MSPVIENCFYSIMLKKSGVIESNSMDDEFESCNVLSTCFNRDKSCFAFSTTHGFRIFVTDPPSQIVCREDEFSRTPGKVRHISIHDRSSIFVLVLDHEPNIVRFWDDQSKEFVGRCIVANETIVRIHYGNLLLVATQHKIQAYNPSNLEVLFDRDTLSNPRGIMALAPLPSLGSPSSTPNFSPCALPHLPHHLEFFSLQPSDATWRIAIPLIGHHSAILVSTAYRSGKSPLGKTFQPKEIAFETFRSAQLGWITFCPRGQRLAVSNETAMVVRIFDASSGTALMQFRRGSTAAMVSSLEFSPCGEFLTLATIGQRTVHIFSFLSYRIAHAHQEQFQQQQNSSTLQTPPASVNNSITNNTILPNQHFSHNDNNLSPPPLTLCPEITSATMNIPSLPPPTLTLDEIPTSSSIPPALFHPPSTPPLPLKSNPTPPRQLRLQPPGSPVVSSAPSLSSFTGNALTSLSVVTTAMRGALKLGLHQVLVSAHKLKTAAVGSLPEYRAHFVFRLPSIEEDKTRLLQRLTPITAAKQNMNLSQPFSTAPLTVNDAAVPPIGPQAVVTAFYYPQTQSNSQSNPSNVLNNQKYDQYGNFNQQNSPFFNLNTSSGSSSNNNHISNPTWNASISDKYNSNIHTTNFQANQANINTNNQPQSVSECLQLLRCIVFDSTGALYTTEAEDLSDEMFSGMLTREEMAPKSVDRWFSCRKRKIRRFYSIEGELHEESPQGAPSDGWELLD